MSVCVPGHTTTSGCWEYRRRERPEENFLTNWCMHVGVSQHCSMFIRLPQSITSPVSPSSLESRAVNLTGLSYANFSMPNSVYQRSSFSMLLPSIEGPSSRYDCLNRFRPDFTEASIETPMRRR